MSDNFKFLSYKNVVYAPMDAKIWEELMRQFKVEDNSLLIYSKYSGDEILPEIFYYKKMSPIYYGYIGDAKEPVNLANYSEKPFEHIRYYESFKLNGEDYLLGRNEKDISLVVSKIENNITRQKF